MDSSASTTTTSTKKNCCQLFCKYIGSPSFYIYCNFLLSQWGDWMWTFAVGLYLLHLSDGKLLLAAIFGFCGGGCILVFGGIIGDWVDRNGRLKVVRVSLILQNMCVMLSAICVGVVLTLETSVEEIQYGRTGRRLLEMAIIVLAIAAQLANMAYTIAIEKDWIVVIAEERSSTKESSSNLANLNAGTRSLGLLCKILSPLTVGFIMTYSSLLTSAIVIAAWNLVSVFVEYLILSHIYRLVPRLAVKEKSKPETEMKEIFSSEKQPMMDKSENSVALYDQQMSIDAQQTQMTTADDVLTNLPQDNLMLKETKKKELLNERKDKELEEKEEESCARKMVEPFYLLVRGWKTYTRQSVVYAGVSLAFLYMTVLGFDSITLGYIYANDVTELVVGICMALAGLTGIIGAALFTRLQKRFGLETTGIVAYAAEILCLILAVVSIWTPGSKFDPYFASRVPDMVCFNSTTREDATNLSTNVTLSEISRTKISVTLFNETAAELGEIGINISDLNSFSCPTAVANDGGLNISIILLLVGIISSRVGLWMADLVVTQTMQEAIVEMERGVVHGVQNSMNMLMDMLKFVLVIVAPQIEIFGFHIIISFSFICMAGLFFIAHVRRTRQGGHLENGHKKQTAGDRTKDELA